MVRRWCFVGFLSWFGKRISVRIMFVCLMIRVHRAKPFPPPRYSLSWSLRERRSGIDTSSRSKYLLNWGIMEDLGVGLVR